MSEQKVDQFEPPVWIWSWGAGTHGQLASADFSDQLEPLQLNEFCKDVERPIDSSSCQKIVDAAGGGAHAVAVVGSKGRGEVLTWGNGQSGALGHGDESDICLPKVVEYLQGIQICSVAAGWCHTAFVSSSGELYTCGAGSFGQLGHGDFEARWIPSKIKALTSCPVSMIACGMRHTLVIANGPSGKQALYGFGYSKRGQLGIGPKGSRTVQNNVKPAGKVSLPRKVVGLDEHQIFVLAANGDHSAALSGGGLYLWGRGFAGSSDFPIPARVETELRFSQVALGWTHCIALADGQVWAWGANDRGQLGVLSDLAAPVNPVVNKPWKDSEVGADSSRVMENTRPTVANSQEDRSTSSSIWAPVERTDAPQGDPSPSAFESETALRSAAVEQRKVSMVVDNASTTVGAMTESDCLNIVRISGLEGKVKFISSGAEHSCAVLEDGRIMIWGWGEHGQLGLGSVSDQRSPKLVPLPSPVPEGQHSWRTFCGSGFTFAIAEHDAQA